MNCRIMRLVLQSIALSIFLGFSGVLFWLAVGEVDEDICGLRTDGGGLYVLDDYGPNVRCDLRIDMVLLGAAFYAVMLFPFTLFMVFVLRAALESVRAAIERRRRSEEL